MFRSYLKQIIHPSGQIELDATEVISKECFEDWISSRKTTPIHPRRSFQRALSAHITGLGGRMAFEENEEIAILKVIRQPIRWPCFDDIDTTPGRGFRTFFGDIFI